MIKKYDLIIFDMDGTLIDSSPGIMHCHRYTSALFGIDIENRLTGVIGGPLLDIYQNRFGLPEIQARKAIGIYREEYAKKGVYQFDLYPDIASVIEKLYGHGCKIALATLKAERFAKQILELAKLDQYFTAVHGIRQNDSTTKAELVTYCIKAVDTTKDKTLLIGDTAHDALGAKEAGVDFCAVTYGFGFNKEDDISAYKPAFIINKAVELLNLL